MALGTLCLLDIHGARLKTRNKKIYMNGDVALKNVKYEHTNRPGFLLGLIDFFTAGLFFLFYMKLGLQEEIESVLGHKVMP